MESVALVVDKLKGYVKSSQDFTNGILHRFEFSNRRNPIEILKRLQREAFSDIMKLRDRQDKVERLISFYKSSKGSPFDGASTRVRGEVEVLGLLLMVDRIHEENQGAVRRAGIRNGINSMITFETTIRQKDTLAAEFVASDKGQLNALDSPLSLAKVLYAANINDWLSLVGVPMGGRCRDVVPTRSSHQEYGVTSYSFSGPPLLNQHIGRGLGLTVRKLNVVASLAQFVSVLGTQLDSSGTSLCLNTFGQVIYQLSNSTRLLLLGLHQVPKFSSEHLNLGPMAVPIGMFKHHKGPKISNTSFGSTALVLESDFDESTRIGGWVEMNSNTRQLHWALSISDIPEADFGWGLSLGGLVQDPKNWDHCQAEAYMKINFGQNLCLQPALVYMMDSTTQFPAFMLKSSWSF